MILFLIGNGLRLLELLIIANVVISYIPAWQRHPLGIAIMSLTEPVLRPFRAVARVGGSGIALDFSPMIALFLIHMVRSALGF